MKTFGLLQMVQYSARSSHNHMGLLGNLQYLLHRISPSIQHYRLDVTQPSLSKSLEIFIDLDA